MTRTMDTKPAYRFRPAPAALALALLALGGCSFVHALTPFDTSSAPYAKDVQPTVPRPAEKPVVKPAAPPAGSSGSSSPVLNGSSGSSAPEQVAQAAPSIPEDRRSFKDDGRYPNLSEVPPRPADLPSFADAQKEVQQLQQDAARAGKLAEELTNAIKPGAPDVVTFNASDASPCLDGAAAKPSLASVRFAVGSSALTADARTLLSEALPDMLAATGPVHVLGQGDPADAQGRFNLAVARAGAVAKALTESGVPVSRVAVAVACADSALAGSSVRLYVES